MQQLLTAPLGYIVASFAVALVAAGFDWRTGRIPNSLTFGALLLALPIHVALSAPGHAWDGIESSLLGLAMCTVPFFVGWRFGWIAGGDVKLVAALGALGGISSGLETVFLTLFCAACFVFLRFCWDGVLFRTVTNGIAVAVTRAIRRDNVVEPRHEFTTTLRLGPFALAGASLSLVLHGGLV
jgi:prepilin peptidase CpaA